ncbi:MAG: TetR/AcrR family transcriptional regulator [Kiritimatiellia bacterium]
MSAHIDHKQRKQLIIARSIILFSEQGYNGVTYQKIADACGFARTVLYQYFKNKCEIFSYAIEQLNNQLKEQYVRITDDRRLCVAERIEQVLTATLTLLYKEQVFMSVVLDHILAGHRAGRSMRHPIRLYTFGVIRALRRLLMEGVRNGEISVISTSIAAQNLYALLESAILRLTISENADFNMAQQMVHQAVLGLKRQN